MTDPEFLESLVRYQDGALSPIEVETFERALRDDPERRRRFARLVRRPPRIILLRAAAANSQQLVHPSLPIRQRCDPHTHTRILAIISAGVQECEREFSGAQLWRPPRANTAQFNTSTFARLGNSQLPKRRLGERVSSSPPTRRVRVRFPGAISRINDAE